MKKIDKVEMYTEIKYYLNIISNTFGIIDTSKGINISSFSDLRKYIKNRYGVNIGAISDDNDIKFNTVTLTQDYVLGKVDIAQKYDIDDIYVVTDKRSIPIDQWLLDDSVNNDSKDWDKCIVIINGKGGSGKDTLINGFREFLSNYRLGSISTCSIIDPVKKKVNLLSDQFHLDQTKNDKFRKFLNDIKLSFDDFDDSNFDYIIKSTDSFLAKGVEYGKCDFLFVTMREAKDIQRYCKYTSKLANSIGTVKLLISREDTNNKTYGNIADDNVFEGDYDLVFSMPILDEDISLALDMFNNFMVEKIMKPHNMIR